MSSTLRPAAAAAPHGRSSAGRLILTAALVLAGAVAWWLMFTNLERFSNWLVYAAIGMTADSRLASAIAFFVYEAPKVLMLLLVVVFGVGICDPSSPRSARDGFLRVDGKPWETFLDRCWAW